MSSEDISEAFNLIAREVTIAGDLRAPGEAHRWVVRPHLPPDREIE